MRSVKAAVTSLSGLRLWMFECKIISLKKRLPMGTFTLPGQNITVRGRHERYPGTQGYRGTGRYSSKFKNLGYRWVPCTSQKKIFGYRWVLGTDQISFHAHPCVLKTTWPKYSMIEKSGFWKWYDKMKITSKGPDMGLDGQTKSGLSFTKCRITPKSQCIFWYVWKYFSVKFSDYFFFNRRKMQFSPGS